MMKNTFPTIKKVCFLCLSLGYVGSLPVYSVGVAANQVQKNTDETTKLLQDLIHYEIDNSFLITQCMDNVKSQTLKDDLLKMRNESTENIEKLSDLLKKYGGEVPTYTKDFKGFFMEGYAAMRGAFTDKGALKALHTNDLLILKAFESANQKTQLPPEVKELVHKVYTTKKESLQLLKSKI